MNRVGAVANEFLNLAKKEDILLTNLKLVKLCYISQGLSLAILDKPLFSDDKVEAWKYGPVIPSIYHEFKHFKRNGITSRSINEDYETLKLHDKEAKKVVLLTWKFYKDISENRLIQLTHADGTPWSYTYVPYKNKVIENKLIKEYYKIFVTNVSKKIA